MWWDMIVLYDILSFLYEFLIIGSRLSMFATRPAVKDRNEVTQIKYFFHDSFTVRQIRTRDSLASFQASQLYAKAPNRWFAD